MDAEAREMLQAVGAKMDAVVEQTQEVADREEARQREHEAKMPSRRRLAVAAGILQGLCANPDPGIGQMEDLERAQHAINQADALIALLPDED